MLFNSWSFLVFLPIVFGLHYVRRRPFWQAGVLILASLVFYAWGTDSQGHPHWQLLPLLFASTGLNGLAAQGLLSPKSTPARRRLLLGLALTFNLGALLCFKYAGLFARLLLPASLYEQWGRPIAEIPLPIGISFYTFQGISLVMEAWRAGPAGIYGLSYPKTGSEVVWFHTRVWLFKTFFPQLVAGPIVKAREFLHQIGPKRFSHIDAGGACKKLALGFFLKMVVADNLREVTASLHYPELTFLPRINLLALLYAFSFQILADFAGYSLIAQGLAKLFGYELPINFNFPYLSRSLTEFWRRWHISLSTWLREYLYFPLGGNRKGELRTYVNLFLVMFLGGLWHGAAWCFALWGTAHGIGLAIERWFGRKDRPGSDGWNWKGVFQAIVVFHVVSFLWLLFKFPDIGQVRAFLRELVVHSGKPQPQALYVIAVFSLPVILWHGWALLARQRATWPQQIRDRIDTGAAAFLAFLTLVNAGASGEFIYFQF